MSRSLCLITGFSRGLGKKCHEIFSPHFHTIGIAKTQGYKCDLSNPENITEFVSELREEYKNDTVRYLVLCHGMHHDTILTRQSNGVMLQQMQTNLLGTMVLTREILKWMLRQRTKEDRAICMLSSIIGLDGNAGQSVYAASKAGMEGFTKSLAKEVGSRGIRVNCVAPGWIGNEGMAHKWSQSQSAEKRDALLESIPLRRMGEPEDVANVVRFLCSEEAKYITGQTIRVDGGLHL